MEPDTKKARTVPHALQSHVFEPSNRNKLREDIANSEPYKYGVIQGLINDDLLRAARKEIMEQLHFTEKETDIYKVNQTGDLANLSGLDKDELAKLNSLWELRKGLYSKEFRELLSEVTGCGPLSGSVQDLSVNLYNKGCHLLNHDDVIGTRRVSYILYLVPPDSKWDPKFGGALRLYPTLKPGVPEADFSVVIPPAWNQLAFFKVQPGHSFHDVEEVYVDKERLSISGWFHIPREGEPGYELELVEKNKEEAAAQSTLKQIESSLTGEGFSPVKDFEAPAAEAVAVDLEKYFNMEMINDSVSSFAEEFMESSMLTLPNFLASEFYEKLQEAIEEDDLEDQPATAKEIDEHHQPWSLAIPPHIHRYMFINTNENNGTGKSKAAELLQELRTALLSKEFAEVMTKITSLVIEKGYAEARRFRPGHDFTLATTSRQSEPILELTISLNDATWPVDVGGYDLVMAADESDADPAVYRSNPDEDAALLTELPASNTAILIFRDSDMLRFIKYVSKNAPGCRWDVNAEYTVANEPESEQESEQESQA